MPKSVMDSTPAEVTVEKRAIILQKTYDSLLKAIERGRRQNGCEPMIERFNIMRAELLQRAKGKIAWAEFCNKNKVDVKLKAEDLFPEPAERGRPPAKKAAAKKAPAKKAPAKKSKR